MPGARTAADQPRHRRNRPGRRPGERLPPGRLQHPGQQGPRLGTRRFLWIKSGAANTTLLDEAFRLISETDAKRDEVTKPADRAVIMRQFGVTKLTHQANQTLRKQADEITDMESFEAFFKQEMSEKGKEKFYYTFRVYNEDLKMIFVNAVAKYTKDMTKKPVAEQHIEMKKPVTAETYRAAAYRLLEHIKGTATPCTTP